MFCFTGRGRGRGLGVLSTPNGKDGHGGGSFIIPPPTKKDVSANGGAPPAGGEVVKLALGGDAAAAAAAMESVFCTTCPATKDDGKVVRGGSSMEGKNDASGRAGRDRAKKKLPLGEALNGGARARNGSAVLRRQQPEKHQQQQSKPSHRYA